MARKSWRTFVVAAFSLAVGTAVNVALFSIVSQLYLEPLPIDAPDEVVRIFSVEPRLGERHRVDAEELTRVERAASALRKVAAFAPIGQVTLSGSGPARRVEGVFTDDRFFDLLGQRPHRGALFPVGSSTGALAVASFELWRALGSTEPSLPLDVKVNGLPFSVVGVAPPGFRGVDQVGNPAVLWMLMGRDGSLPVSRGPNRLPQMELLGRRSPTSTPALLDAQLAAISVGLRADRGENGAARRLTAADVGQVARESLGVADSTVAIPILATTSVLIFLLACLNVSSLLLSQNSTRRQELLTRAALGCGPGRLLRQSFTESAVLALAAALLALPLAIVVLRFIWALRPPLVGSLPVDIGAREMVAALAVSLLTAGLLSLVSTLQTRSLTRVVSHGEWNRGDRIARSNRTGRILVGLQVGVATVVAVGATLTVGSLARLNAIDTGFDASRLWVYGVDLEANELDASQDQLYLKRLLDRASSATGVASAALSNTFFGMLIAAPVTIDDRPERDPPVVQVNGVSPGYFTTMGIEMLGGRDFDHTDGSSSRPVVIVSRSFAEDSWPGESALGLRVTYMDRSREVVGVVEDAKTRDVTEDVSPAVFHPFDQKAFPLAHLNVRFLESSKRAPAHLAEELAPLDPSQALAVSSLRDWVSGSLWGQRVAAWLLAALSTLGLALACVGVYGVVSSWVTQRHTELGVRMALGAAARDLAGLVLRQGLSSVVAGAAGGLIVAWIFSRFMESFLFGIQPQAPRAYVLVLVIVLVAAVVSCLEPAWRAVRIDVSALLRRE